MATADNVLKAIAYGLAEALRVRYDNVEVIEKDNPYDSVPPYYTVTVLWTPHKGYLGMVQVQNGFFVVSLGPYYMTWSRTVIVPFEWLDAVEEVVELFGTASP